MGEGTAIDAFGFSATFSHPMGEGRDEGSLGRGEGKSLPTVLET